MQSKDGHLLSDLASPKESVYAKRKLISKERKEHALKTQQLQKEKQLQLSFNVASPAATIRSHMLAEQKKRNAYAKPTGTSNPVLY